MSKSAAKQISSGNKKIDAIYHNLEWLITAFASTLVFIIFVMQVYRIPTGSMAETLRGSHFRIRCGQCGYRYDHDFIGPEYGMPQTASPSKKIPILHRIQTSPGSPRTFLSSRCPSCGYSEPPSFMNEANQLYTVHNNRRKPAHLRTVFKGDQIFVLKCIYQFFQPKRWDVIVFKKPLIEDPNRPQDNYIKRCIGLPGETIQIIDGDIYVDGVIQRKPEKVQEELWMPVYLNDFQPSRPYENSFNGHSWSRPFVNDENSKWDLNADGPTIFELDSDDKTTHVLRYDDTVGNDFRATYGYDNPMMYADMPVCSDLMIEYYVSMQPKSLAGGAVSKYGKTYQGWVRADGAMKIVRIDSEGQEITLATGSCDIADSTDASKFRFATLDHQLVLEYGDHKLIYDLGRHKDDAGINYAVKPEVHILGQGTLRLRHIGLYRDIHYLSDDSPDPRRHILRATESNPIQLGEDEYFACGDNSPASYDSRLWDGRGTGNNGKTYPAGVVPKDYLVGKGFFIHWPGGYRIGTEPIRWIPFVDGMKPIYGGTE